MVPSSPFLIFQLQVVWYWKFCDLAALQVLEDFEIPEELKDMFMSIPPEDFRMDISSTEIRKTRGVWNSLIANIIRLNNLDSDFWVELLVVQNQTFTEFIHTEDLLRKHVFHIIEEEWHLIGSYRIMLKKYILSQVRISCCCKFVNWKII